MATQEPSVAALVSSAIADARALVQQQIDLAKAELRQSAEQAAASSGMFVGAGVLAFLGFVFLLVSAAYGIVAAGLPVWAGFLIVAAILVVVAGILAAVGRSRARRVGPPQRAIAALTDTADALSHVAPVAGGQPAAPGLDAATP